MPWHGGTGCNGALEYGTEKFKEISEILLPISVLSIALSYGLGMGPITNALLGELLPVGIKSIATALIMALKY